MAVSPAQLRNQYPAWRNLDDAALADAAYEKFYADMPREQFDSKIAGAWSAISGQPGADFTAGINALRARD